MSDTTQTGTEHSKLSKEYTEARKAREYIWKLRNVCFFRLRDTEDKAERKILEAELKKIETQYRDAEDECRTLHLQYVLLNPIEVDRCYCCGYKHADKEGWVIGNRC
jgi:hypothetical protein